MGRIFFMALIGALAGLLAWTATAWMAPAKDSVTLIPGSSQRIENPAGGPAIEIPNNNGNTISEADAQKLQEANQSFEQRYAKYESWLIYAIGAFIGLAMGAGYGMFQGSKMHALRGGGIGIVVGIIGAKLGYAIGGAIVTAILGNVGVLSSPATAVPVKMFGRTLVGAPIGALLGLVMGIPSKSLKQSTLGLIGGAIGGAIGGFIFDPISSAVSQVTLTPGQNSEIGGPGRLVFAILLGLSIGLFTSLIQLASKTAWVRRIYGRNEFKEYIVDAPQTTIGRNETCHIFVGGDPGIAPIHCVIQRHQGNYFLADCQTGMPTLLNGQPIQQVPLFSGAMIQIGSTQLEFVMKQGSAPQKAAEQFRAQQYAAAAHQQPVPAGVQGYAQPAGAPMQAPMPTQMQPQQTMGATPLPGNIPTMVQGAFFPQQSQSAPTPSMGSYCLVAQSGPLSGQRYPVNSMMEIGRDSQTIPLSWDSMISRRHLSIMPSPAGVTVTDLGSTNGTYINDQRITTSSLKQGDILRIGATTFRVEPL